MRADFDVVMTPAKMYDYMLRHTFTSFSGIVGEVLGIVLVIGFFVTHNWIYLLAGILCVFYQPVALYYRAGRQVKTNEVFSRPLHYTVDDTGITVKSGDVCDSLTWDKMYKAVSTSRSVILYTGRINACIFPKEDMGPVKDDVIALISTHMDPKQVNIRL
ncbi:MAG: YcxB family protein [Lachnospiraceae bacterium]|nr:YcxB family protein [Lachnospiraceae bacterium]